MVYWNYQYQIGAFVGYIGYKTACNSGLLYRYVYGNIGAYIPVLFIAILTIGWQGIVVGAFGITWTLALNPEIAAADIFSSSTFLITAIFAGILYTVTTYFGVKGLERISIPSVAILVFVGLYAIYLNIMQAGGLSGFQSLSVAQWFLQILGALGGVVSNDSLFSAFLGVDLNILMKEGVIIGWIGIIGMSLALWTTGDANLYLPVIQTSSILKRPKNVMTVICGILGTILGLGLYQYFFTFLALLASIVPPLIGPVIIEYFLIDKAKFHSRSFEGIASWNPSAFIAYIAGAASTYFSPNFIMPALTGLITSMVVYWVVRKMLK